jgi:predicted nuclease of predicted toxin-antitoxin system
MKILLDMNLSPRWVRFLEQQGFEAAHWSTGPSVVQVRTQDVMPESIGRDVVRVLRLRSADLEQGAVVSIDKVASRVRVLPIRLGSGERGGPG